MPGILNIAQGSISANRGQRRHVVLSRGHTAIELKTGLKIKPASLESAKRDDSLLFGARGELAFAAPAIDAFFLFVTFWPICNECQRQTSIMGSVRHILPRGGLILWNDSTDSKSVERIQYTSVNCVNRFLSNGVNLRCSRKLPLIQNQ
jgi:hypothetical protein